MYRSNAKTKTKLARFIVSLFQFEERIHGHLLVILKLKYKTTSALFVVILNMRCNHGQYYPWCNLLYCKKERPIPLDYLARATSRSARSAPDSIIITINLHHKQLMRNERLKCFRSGHIFSTGFKIVHRDFIWIANIFLAS